MEVKTYLTGAFARPERLIKAFRDNRKGKVTDEELSSILSHYTSEVIKHQKEEQLTYVIDGMLRWNDLFRPLAENMEGVKVNGLARWFDNNLFYKKPVVTGEINLSRSIVSEYIMLNLLSNVRWKLILPEPYTMASMMENIYYRRFDDLLFALAEVIGEEAYNAYVNGVSQVQLSAPYLVFQKLTEDELDIAIQAVGEVRKRTKAEILLHTYYGSVGRIMPRLLDFPVDVVGVDLTQTPDKHLTEYSITKDICLGVIDGRNSMLEDVNLAVGRVMKILEYVDVKGLHISPSCEFEALPYEVALRKVKILSQVRDGVLEEVT
ncbi:MAG TPA: hypothetical protein EYH45_00710 [Candidatus Caldiarchaeum subterraneum]|uniref:Cobalamin-independent methionine synthase MetE N-terminal domain-containing protein n=1 Tax=Caldiarchaeum subterraneum TaxID=311458 RepID=A0A832ZU87_CALS0|nr:hypothetical protein [Candidatus Caldarchaeum subterraneum]